MRRDASTMHFFGDCSQRLTLKDFTIMSWICDMLLHKSYANPRIISFIVLDVLGYLMNNKFALLWGEAQLCLLCVCL